MNILAFLPSKSKENHLSVSLTYSSPASARHEARLAQSRLTIGRKTSAATETQAAASHGARKAMPKKKALTSQAAPALTNRVHRLETTCAAAADHADRIPLALPRPRLARQGGWAGRVVHRLDREGGEVEGMGQD